MKRVVSLLAFGALVAQSGALPAAQEQQQSSSGVKDDAGEVICKKQTVVGSRLAVRKKCLTRMQWANERQNHREAVESVQRPSGSAPTGKTGG